MHVHDFVGIGLGPFNLGLACLTDPLDEVDGVFLEAREQFSWHPGLLLEDATLQVPFLADLVTMADPTSPYSFLNYLKERGRLYAFYIRESFYPLRREYDDYCRWAAEQLGAVEFRRRVERVEYDDALGAYRVQSVDPINGGRHEYAGRRLVLGIGSRPHVPEALAGLTGPAWHTADYLTAREDLLGHDDITVVGSGQSAAEVFSDLLDRVPESTRVRWLTRSPRFFPLEYTKLTLELTSPEYSAHFRSLPAQRRTELLREQAGLYKGISGDLVDQIHEQLYRRSLTPATAPQLLSSCAVTGAASLPEGGFELQAHHLDDDRALRLRTGALVLGTGYASTPPEFLAPIAERLRWEDGRPAADERFALDDAGTVLVQNAELATHGFVAPDLGMGAWRNAAIIEQLAGREVYPIERRIAFQEFGVPDELAAEQEVAR